MIDFADASDAGEPRFGRFEKMATKGECVDSALQYVTARAAVVVSHKSCRDYCWLGGGIYCLGRDFLEGLEEEGRDAGVDGRGIFCG